MASSVTEMAKPFVQILHKMTVRFSVMTERHFWGETADKTYTSRATQTEGDARSITMLPGAAARAPTKKDRDAHQHDAAAKVRTPLRQTRSPL